MIQFLNNIWIALSSENVELVNILLIPLGFIENYLFMNLFLIFFNIKSTTKQKCLYVFGVSLLGLITSNFIPAPFYILANYCGILFLIKFIFKINILKSIVSLILPAFILVLLNMLLQNPFLTLFNISLETFMSVPIYRLSYLLIIYLSLLLVCFILKKFKNIQFSLDLFDNLDKKTRRILYSNLLIGFLALCMQLITTTFYIDMVPMIITIFNIILLISFFILSVYSFTRMIKLSIARKDLQSAEEYNKSLEILYDEVKGFKHDFDNIISTLDGFIENNDMSDLRNYFNEIKKDCKITNNLSVLNPRIINNPGIYSLLNNKYFKASSLGVSFDIEYFLDFNTLDVNLYQLSRILGVLIDNAIEESEKCEDKIVKLSFIRESRNNRAVITIQNTYSNKDVDIEKIFNKGVSGKNNHSGIGLWEVKNYVKKSKNLDLFTSKTDKLFKQELSIYDIQKK